MPNELFDDVAFYFVLETGLFLAVVPLTVYWVVAWALCTTPKLALDFERLRAMAHKAAPTAGSGPAPATAAGANPAITQIVCTATALPLHCLCSAAMVVRTHRTACVVSAECEGR
jgi:hypothetical protein